MKNIAKIALFLSGILFLAYFSNEQDIIIDSQTVVSFASIDEGKTLLAKRDEFIRSMSPLDRAARMKTDKAISERKFISFLESNVLAWKYDEQIKIKAVLISIKRKLSELQLQLDLPKSIYFIKTTGYEEGQAAYTRSNAIILPQYIVSYYDKSRLEHLIVHELLHIFTRNVPTIRKSLYRVIGFTPINEIDFPHELISRKITNPDAPHNNYKIKLSYKEEFVYAVPILLYKEEKYNVQGGGEFFNYLIIKLLIVEKHNGKWKAKYKNGRAVCLDIQQVSGFIEQVGLNTEYIIHAEEILADNFALLVTGETNIPTPAIPLEMKKLLSK